MKLFCNSKYPKIKATKYQEEIPAFSALTKLESSDTQENVLESLKDQNSLLLSIKELGQELEFAALPIFGLIQGSKSNVV